jgi:cytoskeletal protein CcmA (bactofilin family)
MKKLLLPMLAALLALSALSPAATPAFAEELTCRGTLGAITVDNLRVPQNGACTLNGTIVQGSVVVENGARLTTVGARINGNVQAEGAASVTVRANTRIGGSLQVVQGGAAILRGSYIQGDAQFFANTGGVTILNNRIDGNLQCKENEPAPTGSGNRVQGNKEDQCSGL